VPHTTLAPQLSPEELSIAAETALRGFTALEGRVERLALTYCDPYEDIRQWRL